MKLRYASIALASTVILGACSDHPTAASSASTSSYAMTTGSIGINVVLNQPITAHARAQLGAHGRILNELTEINALTMRISADALAAIQALPFVDAATPDAERKGAPVDAVAATNFASGLSTWDLDAVDVTNLAFDATGKLVGSGRTQALTGNGVYVGILDTGLLDSWREYFPQERIATQYARSFGGGGGFDDATVSEQPNKWEHDQNSHGTHVTSSVLGYQLGTARINGVAPRATVIPVKVLNQNGSGWSSVIAQGILYIASLKEGPLAGSPVVINMSLGGSVLDAVEKAAIDYAIGKGVIVVAAAGNEGTDGMSYPGAYAPVISAAAYGWKKEFTAGSWWNALDVPEGDASVFEIADFSSRSLNAQQDLDVAAPGRSVVGPYQVNSGQLSYYYLGGTSMASPHVAGIVALMAQAKSSLTAAQAETILTSTALPIPAVPASEQGSGIVRTTAAIAAAAALP